MQRWKWAEQNAQDHPQNFTILQMQSDTSPTPLLTAAKVGNPVAAKYLKENNPKFIAHKGVGRLFAYRVHGNRTEDRPVILIWAKEHGDEFNTAEFLQELVRFILVHLAGQGTPQLNQTVISLFEHFDLVVVPDMTPDKDFLSYKAHKTTFEDFNDFNTLLQPFNYDSTNPDDYLMAPEAAFLKRIIASLPEVRLGMDIHDPYNTSLVVGPEPSAEEASQFLIVEATETTVCQVLYQAPVEGGRSTSLCTDGILATETPEISWAKDNSISFFSRQKKTPAIFLELYSDRSSDPDQSCRNANYKEGTCTYRFAKDHLKYYLPYFLRLFEITAHQSARQEPKN